MKLSPKRLKNNLFVYALAIVGISIFTYLRMDVVQKKEISWNNEWSEKVRLIGGSELYGEEIDLKWTNTGIEFQFEGTEIWAEMSSACVEEISDEALVGIFVDDMAIVYQTVIVTGKSKQYLLASELSDEPHTVRISKLSEYRDSEVYIKSIGIKGSGMKKTSGKEKIILFVGDSITAGYGVMAETEDSPYTVSEEDGSKTYAYIVANNLQYEARFVCRRGIGVLTNADGSKIHIREMYKNYASENVNADIVCLNIGTNDDRLGGNQETEQKFAEEYVLLLKLIRQTNPNAQIIVTYGAMTTEFTEKIEFCVKQYKDLTGDTKIDFYKFSTSIYAMNDGISSGHPSQSAHKIFADELIEYILRNKLADI